MNHCLTLSYFNIYAVCTINDYNYQSTNRIFRPFYNSIKRDRNC